MNLHVWYLHVKTVSAVAAKMHMRKHVHCLWTYFPVCVVLCRARGHTTSQSPFKESYHMCMIPKPAKRKSLGRACLSCHTRRRLHGSQNSKWLLLKEQMLNSIPSQLPVGRHKLSGTEDKCVCISWLRRILELLTQRERATVRAKWKEVVRGMAEDAVRSFKLLLCRQGRGRVNSVHTGSGAHPVFHTTSTGRLPFPG
jgi:hypothetical protein